MSIEESTPSEEAKSVETNVHIELGVAHLGPANVNSDLLVQQSSTFQFGSARETRSVEFGGSGTFHNQIYNQSIGKQIMPNGPKQCKMQHALVKDTPELVMKPTCTDDDWGFFLRAQLKDAHAYDQIREMTAYQYTQHCDEYWFIACLQRSKFHGSIRDVLWNIQDWCLQVDNFLYRMKRANLTTQTFVETDLNYIKSNCESVATHEAVARLAKDEGSIEGKVNLLRTPLAELRKHMPAKGAPGEKGPQGLVVGPSGPPGPKGLEGDRGGGERMLKAQEGTAGTAGKRGIAGLDGRDGIDGMDGKNGSSPGRIPEAASCEETYCTLPGQFCPAHAPGSSGHGVCCNKSTGKWGPPTHTDQRYVCLDI
jgi:hypothetical protein